MSLLEVARAKPGPSDSELLAYDLEKNLVLDVVSIPEEVLAQAFTYLSQRERASMALVCKRWASISRNSATMWRNLRLELPLYTTSAADRCESFVRWLLPRASHITSIHIVGQRSAQPAEHQAVLEPVVFGNIAAALAVAGPSLRELTIEWAGELVLSGWVAPLAALKVASFSSDQIVVRSGLGFLPSLLDLRFRSGAAPLTLGAPGSTDRLLPPQLQALRVDGCQLRHLPPAVASLTQLTDLVLSNNALTPADLAPLSRMTRLRQLTLMGTRMPHVPQVLSLLTSLRVLYMDWTVSAPSAPTETPIHYQVSDVLTPLRRLGVLSLGSCQLEHFPVDLVGFTSLRALYLDNNPKLEVLPRGPYLRGLRVLGLDWRVLFSSHCVLEGAPLLTKLCVTAMGGIESAENMDTEGDRVVASLIKLPVLRTVLLPMVDGNRMQLFISPLNVALRLAAYPHIQVQAATYGGINNEWIEWLEEVDRVQAIDDRAAGKR